MNGAELYQSPFAAADKIVGSPLAPMGSWSDKQIDNKWKWFFAPTEDRLYERVGAGWNAYSMLDRRTSPARKQEIFFHRYYYRDNPKPNAKSHHLPFTPWTVYSLRIWARHSNAERQRTDYFVGGCDREPTMGSQPIRCQPMDNGTRIAQAIRDGKAIALSDSFFKGGFGTSALVIETEDSEDNTIAINVVPGNTEDHGSYRSELAGIFGQVIMVNTICKVHGITQGEIECGCD
jgi:hypothetical protein